MQLEWIFERPPDHGGRKGGLASSEVFPSTLETLVREALQNCRDQRIKGPDGEVASATVRFTLREISGSELDAFLGSIEWDRLREHVEGSARPELTEIGPKLSRGLDRLDEEQSLRLLLIEDSGTHGLNGAEIGNGVGNFDNLVRSEMINDPNRTDSGGSYGLGKSVYWTFSELSTVLFNSIPSEDPEPLLIGRTDLASHEAEGGDWAGPGFFGVRDLEAEAEGKSRAISIRGEGVPESARQLGFERTEGDTGTSIMIVGFDDPSIDDEPDVESTCRRLAEETVRWYWPALLNGSLVVEIRGEVDGEEIFHTSVSGEVEQMPEDVRPFVEAFTAGEDAPEKAPADLEPGEAGKSEVRITVPLRSDGTSPELSGFGTLLAFRNPESGSGEVVDLPRQGEVALLRGSAMVIEYRPSGGDFEGHAVLLAGKAKADFTETDEAVDQFVRACEPPAHNTWVPDTNRAKKDYAAGKGARATSRSALNRLWEGLKELLTVEEKVAPSTGTDGPRELRERFPLGGKNQRDEPPRRFILRLISAETTDRYLIEASFQRTSTNGRQAGAGWSFEVSLTVAEEGGTKNQPIPLEGISLETPGARSERLGENSFAVTAPGGAEKVEFSLESTRDPLPGVDLRSVWPQLQAKGRTGEP